MKKITPLYIIICIFVMAASFFYFAIYTTTGSKYIAHHAISKYVDSENQNYKYVQGNLKKGLIYKNLELKDIKYLRTGTVVKIQEIYVGITSLSLNGIEVEIQNMRLKIPDSEPIVLSGSLKEGKLDLNIYSRRFALMDVLTYLPDLKKLVPLDGEVGDLDLLVTGDYLEPLVTGGFVIKKFTYKGFILTESPCKINLQLKNLREDLQLFGSMNIKSGGLQTKRVFVKIEECLFNFSGLWNQPWFDFKGNAKVERTKINIALKGSLEKPEFDLTSEPSRSEKKLMVMLATGKSWQSIDDVMVSGLNSGALAKDFIDYFFFSNKSNQFAQRFGMSDFSIDYGQKHRGVSVKKELLEKLEVGYGIRQTKTTEQETEISQKLEGNYQLTDKISVGLEHEVKKKQNDDLSENSTNENNDKVLLKYKTTF